MRQSQCEHEVWDAVGWWRNHWRCDGCHVIRDSAEVVRIMQGRRVVAQKGGQTKGTEP